MPSILLYHTQCMLLQYGSASSPNICCCYRCRVYAWANCLEKTCSERLSGANNEDSLIEPVVGLKHQSCFTGSRSFNVPTSQACFEDIMATMICARLDSQQRGVPNATHSPGHPSYTVRSGASLEWYELAGMGAACLQQDGPRCCAGHWCGWQTLVGHAELLVL